jgi:excisionase family DNA binding protein
MAHPGAPQETEDDMTTQLAYTIAEACAVARAGRTAIYEAIKSGKLVARKRGRRTVILSEDLRRWLDCLPTIASPKTLP